MDQRSKRESIDNFDQKKANEAWTFLEEGINRIYEKQSATLSYEELYRNAYHLTLHRYGDMAYKNLAQALEKNIFKYFQKLNALQDEDFLVHLQNVWSEAKNLVKIIKNIFLYMDRNYVPSRDSSVKPIMILGYETFKKLLLTKEHQLFDKFKREILNIIKSERDGFHIDRILVKNLLHMLIELGTHAVRVKPNTVYGYSNNARDNATVKEVPSKEIYKNYFEVDFLAETKQYYETEAQNLIRGVTCSEYVKQAEKRLNEEKDRLGFYLDSSTEQALISVFISSYIIQNCKALVEMENTGLLFLLQEEKYDEIKRMFKLFISSNESFELFLKSVSAFINKNLETLVSEEENKKDPLKMIEDIIEFHSKIVRILKCSIDVESKQMHFLKIIKDTFEYWLNKNQSLSFNLNQYIDYCLRTSFISKSEVEIDQELNKIIELFKFLRNKDLFEKFYKNFLSSRLLHDKSLSEDYEKSMIEKLRKECGPFYTSKLEIMFKDITISKQTMVDFLTSYSLKQDKASTSFDIDIRILTQGSWPISEITSCTLPQEIKPFITNYAMYYLKNNMGKNITWTTNYGSAQVRVNFPDKKKEFVMTTHQMCISVLFNEKEKLSVAEIQRLSQIPFDEVKNCIEALLAIKLFLNESNESELTNRDIIVFNPDFSHKSYKIKVPEKKKKVLEKNVEETLVQSVQLERKHAVEAAIVRIMKSRRLMEHTQLVEEVIKYSSLNQFTPDVQFIKQMIENLMSREYLDRSADNKNVYVYLS